MIHDINYHNTSILAIIVRIDHNQHWLDPLRLVNMTIILFHMYSAPSLNTLDMVWLPPPKSGDYKQL